jgi:cobalt-zinc-cadmium efflux system outer membrane protein
MLWLSHSCASPARGTWDVDLAAPVPVGIEAWVQKERADREETDLLGNPARLLQVLETENAEIAAARARIGQLEASLDQSRLHPDPSLDLGIGGIALGETNPPDLPSGDSQNYTAGLHQTIELGKREPRVQAADLRLEAERRRFASLLGSKARDARAALGREVYLRERIALLGDNLDAARQMLDLERRRLDQGDLSRNDFDRLSLDTTLLELELPRARAEHEAALADLRAVLGTAGTPSTRGIDALATAAPLPEILEIDAAIESRPDHQAIALEMQAADKDGVLARRRAIPDPVLGVEYTHDRLTAAGNQPNTLEVTLGIGLPLFDRGQNDARKAEERHAELAAGLRESVVEASADATELTEKRRALDGVLRTIEEDAIPRSKQVLDTSTAAFDRGQLSLTDVLLARRTHTELVLRRMDLEYETFGVRNDLRRVLGIDAGIVEPPSRKAAADKPAEKKGS